MNRLTTKRTVLALLLATPLIMGGQAGCPIPPPTSGGNTNQCTGQAGDAGAACTTDADCCPPYECDEGFGGDNTCK